MKISSLRLIFASAVDINITRLDLGLDTEVDGAGKVASVGFERWMVGTGTIASDFEWNWLEKKRHPA